MRIVLFKKAQSMLEYTMIAIVVALAASFFVSKVFDIKIKDGIFRDHFNQAAWIITNDWRSSMRNAQRN